MRGEDKRTGELFSYVDLEQENAAVVQALIDNLMNAGSTPKSAGCSSSTVPRRSAKSSVEPSLNRELTLHNACFTYLNKNRGNSDATTIGS
jgi:hypothetical protein